MTVARHVAVVDHFGHFVGVFQIAVPVGVEMPGSDPPERKQVKALLVPEVAH